ncbi:MAG: glycosyl transferase family 2 [Flavobacteriales bacterium]|nr:glycosyl transferase family 2 [Flavobacteriales bacterium]|tara:strand:+ start:4426 stop:5538 length:1113 start_codon:yes stop_codon:yes gene_type:complete
MFKNKTIAVVVPSYNEEQQIGMVIETMPDFVDRIVIVNDCSKDNMNDVVKSYWNKPENDSNINLKDLTNQEFQTDVYNYKHADLLVHNQNIEEKNFFTPHKISNSNPNNDRIILIDHLKNGGVGAAIATGYKWCKDRGIDCTAVMAGDGQMDPEELEGLCQPVIEEGVDYVKGNRLKHPSAWIAIPKVRFFGNSALSIMNKLASGYWRISDTQTGYTAISSKALNSVRLYKIYPRYGMPNDLLVKLNIADCTLREMVIKPVYNVGEQSKMKIFKVIPKISTLLLKSFFKRLWIKYFFKDFHPLFLFYNLSFILGAIGFGYGIKILYLWIFSIREINTLTILAFLFLSVTSLQLFFFGMWLDIQDNQRLYK